MLYLKISGDKLIKKNLPKKDENRFPILLSFKRKKSLITEVKHHFNSICASFRLYIDSNQKISFINLARIYLVILFVCF